MSVQSQENGNAIEVCDHPTVGVTGGTGFVGRTLVLRLLEAGASVKLLSRRADAARLFGCAAVEAYQGDLLEPVTLRAWADGATTVYHLAGETRDPRQFAKVNIQGTVNALTACQFAGVRRFVYVSSAGVIGADGAARLVDERTVPEPRSAYEKSKLAAEMRALQCNRPGFAVAALRPSIVYGEGARQGRDSVLTLMRLLRAERCALLGRRYLSSYVYAGDVAAACQTLAHRPTAAGHSFIINEPIPLTQFLDEAASILQVRKPWVLPSPVGMLVAGLLKRAHRFGSLYNQTNYCGAKLGALGFRLPFGFREGLRRTLTWYEQNGFL